MIANGSEKGSNGKLPGLPVGCAERQQFARKERKQENASLKNYFPDIPAGILSLQFYRRIAGLRLLLPPSLEKVEGTIDWLE